MSLWHQAEQTEYGSAEEYFSIVRRIVLKRWWVILLLTVAAGVAGFAGSMLVEPVYRASTTIRIQQNLLGQVSQYRSGNVGEGALDTEAVWIKNRLLIEEVMDKTGAAATARSQKERVAVMEKLRNSINVTIFSNSLQVSVDWNGGWTRIEVSALPAGLAKHAHKQAKKKGKRHHPAKHR